jgi:hypothetical protein
MRFGSPWGAGWGSPENHLAYATTRRIKFASGLRDDESAIAYCFMPRTGLGDAFFGIYLNGRKIKTVRAAEGEETQVLVPAPWGSGVSDILALRHGHLSDPSYATEKVVRVMSETYGGSKRITLEFDFKPNVAEPLEDDGGYTSTWDLAGLEWGVNTRPVEGYPSRAELDLAITVSGGNVTITLSLGDHKIAEGTAVIGGAPFNVNLLEQNGSGVSGSVTVDDSVATVAAATLVIRWPKEMIIKRGTSNPPTVEVDRVRFKGQNIVRWTEVSDLADGTYYYRTQPNSDTGDAGTASSVVSKAVASAPAAPSDLAYASGNAAACHLSFTPSATPGATHRIYLATTIGQVMSMQDPNPAGTVFGSGTVLLPAISGYPGKAYALLRAVSAGGVEEKNLDILELEFNAAGNFETARPNTPGIIRDAVAIANGRATTFRISYDPRHEKAVATHIKLFKRTPTGAYNFASADGTVVLQNTVQFLKIASFSYTFPSNGWWFVKCLGWTGSQLSDATDALEFKIYVSDADMPASTELTAQLTRG